MAAAPPSELKTNIGCLVKADSALTNAEQVPKTAIENEQDVMKEYMMNLDWLVRAVGCLWLLKTQSDTMLRVVDPPFHFNTAWLLLDGRRDSSCR
jgi:hypothetical protein